MSGPRALDEAPRSADAEPSPRPVLAGTAAEPSNEAEWRRWMRTFGVEIRRVREFIGLSQERVARLAGVSQGAVSRLEAGHGLATPFMVVMRVQQAVTRHLRTLEPQELTPELRRAIDLTELLEAPLGGASALTVDERFERFVRLYRDTPEMFREQLVTIASAAARGLTGDRE